MKKLFLLAVIMAGSLGLVACGGDGGDGGGSPALVASQDLTVPVGSGNGTAMATAVTSTPFTFTSGVPAFGTTATTTLTVTAPATTGAAPGFVVTSGGNTASGDMEFGSCIFNVRSSSFPSGPLAPNGRVTVQDCSFEFDTGGVPADGVSRQVGVVLILNQLRSQSTLLVLVITPSGNVTVNNVTIGSTPVVPVTGS